MRSVLACIQIFGYYEGDETNPISESSICSPVMSIDKIDRHVRSIIASVEQMKQEKALWWYGLGSRIYYKKCDDSFYKSNMHYLFLDLDTIKIKNVLEDIEHFDSFEFIQVKPMLLETVNGYHLIYIQPFTHKQITTLYRESKYIDKEYKDIWMKSRSTNIRMSHFKYGESHKQHLIHEGTWYPGYQHIWDMLLRNFTQR